MPNHTNWKLFYLRSINPMIEKINPTIPIPITSSPIPDEQREIIMAKSSIAIPNPIFFIVNSPLQIPISQFQKLKVTAPFPITMMK